MIKKGLKSNVSNFRCLFFTTPPYFFAVVCCEPKCKIEQKPCSLSALENDRSKIFDDRVLFQLDGFLWISSFGYENVPIFKLHLMHMWHVWFASNLNEILTFDNQSLGLRTLNCVTLVYLQVFCLQLDWLIMIIMVTQAPQKV